MVSLIFIPRISIPFVRDGAGMNVYTEKNFRIHDDNQVIVNLPHLGIHDGEYSLRDLLEKAIQFGPNGILQAYSNASASLRVKFISGVISRIDVVTLRASLGIANNHIPFAIDLPTAIMGDTSQGEHAFPNVFHFEKDLILIGSNSHPNHPKNKSFELMVTIYFYIDRNLPWQEVLYKSLYEFSRKNYNISLVLLFSSLEICTNSLYSECEFKPPKIWERLKDLCSGNISKKFDKKIAKVRNAFEHEHQTVTPDEIKKAYECAFNILWELSKIEKRPMTFRSNS